MNKEETINYLKRKIELAKYRNELSTFVSIESLETILKESDSNILRNKILEVKEKINKNIELQWTSTNYNEIEVEKYQYVLEILDNLLNLEAKT